jgi:glyoxylase-like metal-dependent hydrolase (beta-lactamase superfamily II)
MLNYVYAVGDREAGDAVLVDPAWAPAELVDLLAADGFRLAGVVLTHYHPDHAGGDFGAHHVSGVRELLEIADVPVHVQAPEVEWLAFSAGLDSSVLVPHEPGDTLAVGDVLVRLLRTPGHTPGSQCLLLDPAGSDEAMARVITGDTLFLNGCGRTDLPGGDPDALYESLTRLAALPDGTAVFAGHAYDPSPSADIGVLRRRNPVLVPRTAEEWRRRFA